MKKQYFIIVGLLITVGIGLAFENLMVERPLAIVRRFKPQVEIKKAGSGKFVEATAAHQLFSGDTLKTGPEGYVAVQFMDNSLVKVKPNSILTVMGEVRGKDNTASRLAVQVGEIFLNVTKRESDFEVQSPNIVAAVKGTKFNTNVKEDGSATVIVIEGVVEVTARGSGQKVTTRAGDKATVSGDGKGVKKSKASTTEMNSVKNDDNNGESNQNQDDDTPPKVIKLRFINESGEIREFEIKYREQN